MNTNILCIDDNESRVMDRQKSLEGAGFVVMNAGDEAEAVEVLTSRRVDVVFVDARSLRDGRNHMGVNIKSVRPQVPIVLICEDGTVPAGCREHVDVTIDEADVSQKAKWLIEELQDTHFPFFEEWFDGWQLRASESRSHGLTSCAPNRKRNDLVSN